MSRPFRRYSFMLAERLGMSVQRLHREMTGAEIIEWVAFDKTTHPEWVKTFEKNQELEKSKAMSVEEKVAAFKQLFGGGSSKDRNGNNRKSNR